jgi:hypothetical protein
MRDAHESLEPTLPTAAGPVPNATTAPDPADLGTAYGMELSIDPAAKQVPAEDDLSDPVGWIRRWVDQRNNKTG